MSTTGSHPSLLCPGWTRHRLMASVVFEVKRRRRSRRRAQKLGAGCLRLCHKWMSCAGESRHAQRTTSQIGSKVGVLAALSRLTYDARQPWSERGVAPMSVAEAGREGRGP